MKNEEYEPGCNCVNCRLARIEEKLSQVVPVNSIDRKALEKRKPDVIQTDKTVKPRGAKALDALKDLSSPDEVKKQMKDELAKQSAKADADLANVKKGKA
jgi:hypothetical protein